jgi:hypothetical protein
MTDSAATATTPKTDWRSDPHLSEKWKFRFGFFEKYGIPKWRWRTAPELRTAFKLLSFRDRIKISANWYAFFFGFIYYAFFLKLWRQALILIGIYLVLIILGIIFGPFNVSGSIFRGMGFAYSIFCSMRANVLYYLKRTQGDIGWMI